MHTMNIEHHKRIVNLQLVEVQYFHKTFFIKEKAISALNSQIRKMQK